MAVNPAPAEPATNRTASDKLPYTRNLDSIKRTVETLRGKKFKRDVPAFTVSEKEMRSIADHDLDEEYPGDELASYQALMIRLDMLPPDTDLRRVEEDLFVGAAAGFYDTDTKEMCIPSFSAASTNAWKNPVQKKMENEAEEYREFEDDVVFAHEFTHALEDQYWPLDDPQEKARHESTDRDEAWSFREEGSATRLMIEAVPALVTGEDPGRAYPIFWNLIHSGACEFVLDSMLKSLWKSPDALVPGAPEQLARAETMEYSYGYSFCTRIMRNWGLDGLDYFCEHPPASTAQVMHPDKAWEWRDWPFQITLPKTFPNGGQQLSSECLGEAGISVILGCSFQNLQRGAQLACGWKGDRAALYQAPDGHRLLVWASAWDSDYDAAEFGEAWVKERQALHKASVTHQDAQGAEWVLPDGHAGSLRRENRRVLIFEADGAEALAKSSAWSKAIAFRQPPEEAIRATANHMWLRINPVFSWQKDADYTVSKTLWGLLSRHDGNSVGEADRLLLGLLVDSHRTPTFHKWELGWSCIAKHDSDSRRGISRTGILPWSVLYSQFKAKLPPEPQRTIARRSVLWGLAFSQTKDSGYGGDLEILPAGILFRSDRSAAKTATYILGTGSSRSKPTAWAGSKIRFRLLGIPVWTRSAEK